MTTQQDQVQAAIADVMAAVTLLPLTAAVLDKSVELVEATDRASAWPAFAAAVRAYQREVERLETAANPPGLCKHGVPSTMMSGTVPLQCSACLAEQ